MVRCPVHWKIYKLTEILTKRYETHSANSGVHDSVFCFSHPLIFFLACALLTLILSAKNQNPALNFMPAAVLQFLTRTKGACKNLLWTPLISAQQPSSSLLYFIWCNRHENDSQQLQWTCQHELGHNMPTASCLCKVPTLQIAFCKCKVTLLWHAMSLRSLKMQCNLFCEWSHHRPQQLRRAGGTA
jgi:hypothetical protein